MKTESKRLSNEPGIKQEEWSAILKLYHACLKNAGDLLTEAELLLEHSYHARAFTLAICAYEEIGKSQIVADYFNNMVSKKEVEEAFKSHEIKSAYNGRKFAISSTNPFKVTISYNRKKAKTYSLYRMKSLYVNYKVNFEPENPADVISADDAKSAIDAGRHEIDEILKYEAITERIGSKSFTK